MRDGFKRFFNIIQREKFKFRKEESFKRGRLNFKDGEDVKCVLHKFPYLENSDTLKINPKSKILFYLLRITLQILFILHKLFTLHNIYF
jgi:hypothetical protein